MAAAASGFARGAETGDYAERSKDLKEALEKVKAVLPEGWEAKIKYGEFERLQVILLVERKQKAKARLVYMNPVQPVPEEDYQIEFNFLSVPYRTPQEVTELAHQNVVKAKKRMDAFEALEASGFHGSYPHSKPLPPCAYKPKNEKEEDALRQYGLIWVDTEPVRLPTHYHKGLSFEFWDANSLDYSNPAVGKEIEDVRQKISAALIPYAIPPGARK
ncbi:MAG: hypothetical protein L6R28_01980 [Planctomycetes bacterium]|nr:hypothetical protein [Planctomycetota bacterium]